MKYLIIQLALMVIVLVAAINLIGPAEEPLTELYFNDHTSLPSEITTRESAAESIRHANYSAVRFTYVDRSREINVLEIFESSNRLNSSQINTTFPFTRELIPSIDPEGLADFSLDNKTIRYRLGEISQAANLTETRNFSFVIRNLEEKTVTYNYEITREDLTSIELPIEFGKVTLQNNESALINSSFSVWQGFNRTRISVHLIDMPQSIHFWVNEK